MVNTSHTVPVHTDPLMQWALESDELLGFAIEDIPPETRQWLSGSGIGQVLVMALRTAPEHEPSGVLLVADLPERRWSERHLAALGTLVSQIAWSRRYLLLTETLSSQQHELERLNWYKHRRLEDLYRTVTLNLKRLNELGASKDPLFNTRQQQILRQIDDAIAPVSRLVQEELWKVRTYPQTLSLVTLLKRALERADWLIKQRQLWSQVHNETNLTIGGDIAKIELVLYELLLVACQRSNAGGRIDIWCRQIDSRWLEVSVTDNGQVDPRLFIEFEAGGIADLLAPSTLTHPPGLHLAICQSLMKQIGGEFTVYRVDDGRIVSRLVLPIAGGSPPPKS